jgi:alcohol dehydrogenase YqhD (iron-dependent ADH family)
MPYYRFIYKHGLQKFMRFAKNVWEIDPIGKTDDALALAGIDALESFSREMGIPSTLRELGATEDMLEKIAYSVEEGGGYKKLSHEDILTVLKACF